MTRRESVDVFHDKVTVNVKRRGAGVNYTGKQSWGGGNLLPIGPAGVCLIILLVFDLEKEFHGIFERAQMDLLSLPYRVHFSTMSEEIIEVDWRLAVMFLDNN